MFYLCSGPIANHGLFDHLNKETASLSTLHLTCVVLTLLNQSLNKPRTTSEHRNQGFKVKDFFKKKTKQKITLVHYLNEKRKSLTELSSRK